MIKVLYAGRSIAEPLGGGELSAKTMLAAMSGQCELRVVGAASQEREQPFGATGRLFDHPMPSAKAFSRTVRLTQEEVAFRAAIVTHLADFDPDVVFLQHPSYLRPSDLSPDTKVVCFVRSPTCFSLWDPTPVRWKRPLVESFVNARFRRFRPLLERANLIVANSGYMQAQIERRRGLSSITIPPFIDTRSPEESVDGDPARDADREILFIRLEPSKGAALALGIARSMPDRRF